VETAAAVRGPPGFAIPGPAAPLVPAILAPAQRVPVAARGIAPVMVAYSGFGMPQLVVAVVAFLTSAATPAVPTDGHRRL
jgi:hypothetical protein